MNPPDKQDPTFHETFGTDPQDIAVTLNYIEQAVREGDRKAMEDLFWKLDVQIEGFEEECEKKMMERYEG